MENKKIIRPKRVVRMKASSIRIPEGDMGLILSACFSCGESRSEFLRAALKERALRILGGQDQGNIREQ